MGPDHPASVPRRVGCIAGLIMDKHISVAVGTKVGDLHIRFGQDLVVRHFSDELNFRPHPARHIELEIEEVPAFIDALKAAYQEYMRLKGEVAKVS